MTLDISVIIPTYNRAKDLRRTLEGIAKIERKDLSVEFIVVDNASTDQTKYVIDSFSNRIPIRYIYEPHSGKNRALNCALDNSTVANIVVFTDDDVDVPSDWLVSIASICDRWPNYSVFGGRVNVIFPNKNIPKWASDPFIRAFAFAYHNYSTHECIYEDPYTPYGPNYWVRRSIFADGRRFNESMGPHPTKRTLFDETSFLLDLSHDGYEIVFSPKAVVGHRIQPEMLKLSAIFRRAYQSGRGYLYINGLPRKLLLKGHPVRWQLYKSREIIFDAFKVLRTMIMIFLFKENRVSKCVIEIQNLACQIEAMRMARKEKINSFKINKR